MPLEDVEAGAAQPGAAAPQKQYKTLYIRLDTMGGRQDRKVRPVLQMFPGRTQTVLFYADTRQRLGTNCLIDRMLLDELVELLGEENVVLK